MTELEKRLRDDAAKIRAEAGPELRARVQASVRAEEPAAGRRRRSRALPVRWPRLLGGAALATAVAVAAVTVMVLRPEAPAPEQWPTTPVADTSPTPAPALPAQLRAEFVLLELDTMATQSLEEEKERLEADLQKLEQELRRAF